MMVSLVLGAEASADVIADPIGRLVSPLWGSSQSDAVSVSEGISWLFSCFVIAVEDTADTDGQWGVHSSQQWQEIESLGVGSIAEADASSDSNNDYSSFACDKDADIFTSKVISHAPRYCRQCRTR